MEGLTVGTTVHFVYPDYTGDQVGGNYPLGCYAAIVTRVLDEARGTVNLLWFDDVRSVSAFPTPRSAQGVPQPGSSRS